MPCVVGYLEATDYQTMRGVSGEEVVMGLGHLGDLLVQELGDLYDAEKHLVEALPAMAEAAVFPELREAFELHVVQTQEHIGRLDKVFKLLDLEPPDVVCEGMRGIVAGGRRIIDQDAEDQATKDAALIAIAQKMEHYEIAGYGSVRTYAHRLERDDVADLLQQTLDEEAATDRTLTSLAESTINPGAADIAERGYGGSGKSGIF